MMSLNDKLQSFVASVFGVHKAGYNHTTEDQLWDMLRDHIDQKAELIERLKGLLNRAIQAGVLFKNGEVTIPEIERLKDALFEWMMHHWGLHENDEIAAASHSARHCWETGLAALDEKSDKEFRLRCLEHLKHLKWLCERALEPQKGQDNE